MNRFLSLLLVLVGTIVAADAQPPADPPPPPRDPNIPVITLPPIERVQLNVMRVHVAGPDWGVVKLKAPAAWAVTKGKGSRVAVLDTGCDINHPDLKNRVRTTADVKDFTGSRSGPTDRQGHGTHTAGSVLADGPLPGVAPEADLIVGKVLDDSGSGGVDGIAAGIRWAITRNADVISMSLGGSGQDSYIPPALKEAEAAGVLIVVAAGNSGPREGTVDYPGGYPQSICIGAVDVNLRVASFSSRGPQLHTAGPGVNVRSTLPGGQYGTMSGTSMATPNIAGVAALWCAAHPEVPKKDRPAKFREALVANSADLGPTGRDTAYGFGFPDAAKVVAGGVTPPIPPKPPDPPVPPQPGTGFTGMLHYQNGVLMGVYPGMTPLPPAPMPTVEEMADAFMTKAKVCPEVMLAALNLYFAYKTKDPALIAQAVAGLLSAWQACQAKGPAPAAAPAPRPAPALLRPLAPVAQAVARPVQAVADRRPLLGWFRFRERERFTYRERTRFSFAASAPPAVVVAAPPVQHAPASAPAGDCPGGVCDPGPARFEPFGGLFRRR